MVVLHRTKTVLLAVLVVMAATVANGTRVPGGSKGDAAAEPAEGAGAAAGGAKAAGGGGPSVDVKASGAKGDGKTDDAPAFLAAWKQACGAGGTMVVPKGEYLISGAEFLGPCKGPVTMELNGNLKAPPTFNQDKSHAGWLEFTKLTDFTLNGNGAILDGCGSAAWKANDCAKTGNCNNLPINVRFTGLTNSKIINIISTNSKLFHINVLNCNNVTMEAVGIQAPAESLNTDGIHFGRSNGVILRGSKIATGDDCVSIGGGTENLLVEDIECGPGHGIAIGSLGKYPDEKPVVGITIRKSIIRNTDNGVRIKTWPGSRPGIVDKVLFEDITMENVTVPILIDQEYCPHGKCKTGPSMVKLSNIAFKNIKGTSSTKIAVKLICSKGAPCEGVSLADIDLVSKGKEGPAVSACANVKPAVTGKMIPAACTEVAKPDK